MATAAASAATWPSSPAGSSSSVSSQASKSSSYGSPTSSRRTGDHSTLVTQIRNRLMLPKAAQERVYQLDGLVAEVWLLARHYLVLLILHSLGYQGSYP